MKIDEICAAFARAWRSGERPRIEDYIGGAPVGSRRETLEVLLREEVGQRLAAGENVTAEDYQARFPDHCETIARALDVTMSYQGVPKLVGRDRSFPDSRRIPPPNSIGRYRIDSVLGQGSFGIVYLAHDGQLQRPVAIKVPHANLVPRREDAQEYLIEARTVANLDHPNIVPVYDVGQTDDVPCFIVSKYIAGSTLAKRMSESRLGRTEAVSLVLTVAEALHHAHCQGLVHRDIKPGNILLDAHDSPFVVDFGLVLRDSDVGKGTCFAGTPVYMSPEQARGEADMVDARSDIYSLGVVLFQLLTGRLPYRQTKTSDLMHEISSGEARPPRQLDETIPKELDRICVKAMSKRAAERYSTAQDLADDLNAWLVDVGTAGRIAQHDRHISTRSSLRSIFWIATVTVCAGATLLFGVPWLVGDSGQKSISSVNLITRIDPSDLRSGAAPSDATPIRVAAIEVSHFAKTSEGAVPRGVLGRSTFRAPELNDQVQVQVRLSRPAFAYLIAFRPDGKSELCFPEHENIPPSITDSPCYPVSDSLKAYGLREGAGLWVFAVLASETPLPAYREWLQRRFDSQSDWEPVLRTPPGVVWWDDGLTGVISLTAATGLHSENFRGKGEVVDGPAMNVRQLTQRLRFIGQVDIVAAIGFGVTSQPEVDPSP